MNSWLLHSNAPWANTGYGTQIGELARQIASSGRTVTMSSNYGLQGMISQWEGLEVLPCGFDQFSRDVIPVHHHYTESKHGPTVLLTLFDVWVYEPVPLTSIKRIASWIPIDHDPIQQSILDWCARPNVTPIAMSHFGSAQLDARDVAHRYAPHSVDTSIFTPGATVDDLTGRDLLGLPEDAFVVGIVAANKGHTPSRKSFAEQFQALGKFMKAHDDVIVYLHTDKTGAGGGINLPRLAEACCMSAERVAWVDQWSYYAGLDHRVLAAIFNAFDVNLLCSRGEGFGVPALEAAACGIPSIVSDFTAQPELAPFGYLAEVQREWDEAQGTWWGSPRVDSILEQLESAYLTASARKVATRRAAEPYDHNTVFTNHWLPILGALELP